MIPPKLFRIKCADLDHRSARHIRHLRLESRGSRTVARATEVRGRVWKDFAGVGVLTSWGDLGKPAYASVVLSRRCVERFIIPEDMVFDVDLSGVQSGRKSKREWRELDYVALVPHGGVDFAKKIWRYDSLQPNNESRYALIDTWDGTDYVTQPAQSMDFFCSLRVVETARAERWTGFGFHPADLSIGVQALWQGIDYLGDQWPPRRWYPPDPATFTGVADWIGVIDEVGDRAGRWVTLMMREFDEWASQDALDWIAAYITQHEPGTPTVDYAARVCMYSAAKHDDRFRFDPVALEGHTRSMCKSARWDSPRSASGTNKRDEVARLDLQNTTTEPELIWITQSSTIYSNIKHISNARSEPGRLMVEEIRGRVWTDCLATRVAFHGLTPKSMYETIVVSDRCASVLDAAEILEVVLPQKPRSESKKSLPHHYMAISGEPGFVICERQHNTARPCPDFAAFVPTSRHGTDMTS